MPTTFDLSTLNGLNGFTFLGAASDQSGYCVSSAGDVNGDGITDIIIGAPYYPIGASYVIFGRSGFQNDSLDLSALNGSNGCVIPGLVSDKEFGRSVSAAGDINADGISDIIIGSPYSNLGAGVSYVIFGKRGIWNATFNLASLDGSNGFVVRGIFANDHSGFSSSGLGDINNDGIDDFIMGAPDASPGGQTREGISYVIFGKAGAWNSTFNLSALDGDNGFIIPGKISFAVNGYAVSGAKDVNADGIMDIIIDSPGAAISTWEIYVLFGRTQIGKNSVFNLASLNGTSGFSIRGLPMEGANPISVSALEDVNADGIADIIIGVPYTSPNGKYYSGISYVVFGQKNIGHSGRFDVSTLNGTNGFRIFGLIGRDQSGYSVSGAGDFNGDGIADFMMGANQASPNSLTRAGASYVVFGKAEIGASGNFNLSTLDGSNGIGFSGMMVGFSSGSSVSSAGDINGDGVTDIIIGAPGPLLGSYRGTSYVVFGNRPPQLLVNQLIMNQGETLVLTSTHLNAVDPYFPNDILQFEVANLQHGSFSWRNGIGPLTLFSQSAVQQGQIQFIHDGSPNAPSYDISVHNPRVIFLPNKAANVTFNTAPTLVTNSLVVNRGQTVALGIQSLVALDDSTPPGDLSFSISNLHHGVFTDINQPNSVLTTFFQNQTLAQQIQFTHDGSSAAPNYSVSVSNGRVSNIGGPQLAQINFYPEFITNPIANNSNPVVIGAAIGSILGAVALIGGSALYCKYQSKNRLQQTINHLGEDKVGVQAEFHKHILLPIAKKIFQQIKITGCLGYITAEKVRAFVSSIETLLGELQKQNVNIEIEKMSPENQQHFFNIIVEKIRLHMHSKPTYSTRFFKAEITPIQIEDKAYAIANAVQQALSEKEIDEIERTQKASMQITRFSN